MPEPVAPVQLARHHFHRGHRVRHRVDVRHAVKGLGVAADGILQGAFESDPALLGHLQAGFGLQDIDGDARAALDALILQIELLLDGGFVLARQFDQPLLPQHVEAEAPDRWPDPIGSAPFPPGPPGPSSR